MSPQHFWVRAEARATERRTPLVPSDAATLVRAGHRVSVEESAQRVIGLPDYAAVGAEPVETGSWPKAPDDAVILGIKELPEEPYELRHTHVFFAHALKGQHGAGTTLDRFRAGGGRLLDVEYLVDEQGRRTVAFGYWAGYVGAALGVLQLTGSLVLPLTPSDRDTFEAELSAAGAETALGLVTGARGRSGSGAQRALATAGVVLTRWDRPETRDLHKQALLGHDLLVNCVFATEPTEPFLVADDLSGERRLSVVADVTCDVTGPANMLPVNTATTTWEAPARRLHAGDPTTGAAPLDIIAVDNLPSLVPAEASQSFSADLSVELAGLDPLDLRGSWAAAFAAFEAALAKV